MESFYEFCRNIRDEVRSYLPDHMKNITIDIEIVRKVNLTYTGLSRLFVHIFLVAIMYVYVLFRIGPSWYNLQFFLYCHGVSFLSISQE